MAPFLQFKRFRAFRVVVPARRDVIFPFAPVLSEGVPWDYAPITLVEGETIDGLIAFGESDRGASRADVERTLRHILTLNLQQAHPTTSWHGEGAASALPGLYPAAGNSSGFLQSLYETLWLDAVGKAAGLPAHALLGGKVRDRVSVDAWANRPDTVTLTRLVRDAAESGYRGMKLKCDSTGDVVRVLWEIRHDVPKHFHFTIDPMCAWRTYRESARIFGVLEELDFSCQIEDPFPHDAMAEWHRARAVVRSPLIWHARSQALLQAALAEDPADAFNLIGHPSFQFVESAAMAMGGRKHCWHGSSLELGIQQHARLHACAVAPACEMPSDLQSLWVRGTTLTVSDSCIVNGTIAVPNEPGLGARLDHAQIGKYCIEQWEIAAN